METIEKDLEKEKKKNKDLKKELDKARKDLQDERMVSLDLTDMSSLEQQKDDLQRELEDAKKENESQLIEKDKEIEAIKKDRDQRNKEKDRIYKNYEEEKRKKLDLNAEVKQKEIEYMDLDEKMKLVNQKLKNEENVKNIRKEKDVINERYIAQIDQIALYQSACIERDEKIKKLEEELKNSKLYTPEKKRKLNRNRDSSTDGEFSTPLNKGAHRRETPTQDSVQDSQGARQKVKQTQKCSGHKSQVSGTNNQKRSGRNIQIPQDDLVSGTTNQEQGSGPTIDDSGHQTPTQLGEQAEGTNDTEIAISGGENSEIELSTGERDPRRGRQRERTHSTARSADSGSASEGSRKRGRETFKKPIPVKDLDTE